MADCRGTNFNIILLGFAFMLIFTGFQTCAMVQKIVLENVKNETNGTDVGDGFISLSIIYVVFAFANWLAPAVVSVLGAKVSMIIGASLYLTYVAMFLRPRAWSLYLCSTLIGLGATVLWTGQGSFLTLNSKGDTMGRNSGIFWALFQSSLVLGNVYVFVAFKGVKVITHAERTQLFIILSSLCAAGMILLIFLRTVKAPYERLDDLQAAENSESQEVVSNRKKAWIATKMSFHLLKTKEMLLLAVTFIYTGLELTMLSGVFGTAVGHTTQFGDQANSYLGLCGILIGVGEIVGGGLFGIFGKRTVKHGRDQIILLGFLSHIAAFYLMFLFLSECSPLELCDNDIAYKPANQYAMFVTAFLMGFGDSSYNTQVYSLIGFLFPNESAPAFALYNFFKSLSAAVAFYYSTVLLLQWQLLILTFFAFTGTLTFFLVEWHLPAE